MYERHPRSVLGWNSTHFFLGEVDGRQRRLSVGMTLEELGEYMARMGCSVAMSLDGGGSATLWFDGRVRNSPCDGAERPVANGLVVTRKSSDRPSANVSAAAVPLSR
jgi:exopolysaccharide biosynthesis protein